MSVAGPQDPIPTNAKWVESLRLTWSAAGSVGAAALAHRRPRCRWLGYTAPATRPAITPTQSTVSRAKPDGRAGALPAPRFRVLPAAARMTPDGADQERFCVVTLSSAGMPERIASKPRHSAGISWSEVSTFSPRPPQDSATISNADAGLNWSACAVRSPGSTCHRRP
jgi:hypothetical protein